MTTVSPDADENASHTLRKVLGLRDLVPMQILIVIGTSWTGTAAHQAGTQVSFWILGAVLLFLPVALIPAWFTRLHPRYRAPTRSLAIIALAAVLFSFLASSSAGANEAFQLLVTSAFVCYGINYLLMFRMLRCGVQRSSQRQVGIAAKHWGLP